LSHRQHIAMYTKTVLQANLGNCPMSRAQELSILPQDPNRKADKYQAAGVNSNSDKGMDKNHYTAIDR